MTIQPSEPKHLYIDETEPRLHVADWGGSGPPVLLLHGLTGRSTGWGDVARQLGLHFRPVALDLRGHGESGRPVSGYNPEALASDVLRVLDALDIRRAHLIGHSLGGRIAFDFAAAFPQRVERLIIEEAHPAPYEGAGSAYAQRMAALSVRRPDREAWAAYLMTTRGESSARWYLQSLDAVDDEGVAHWAFSPASIVAMAQQSLEAAAWTAFSAVKCPVLLLIGEHSDRDVDRHVVRMKAVQPDLKVRTIAGTGHWIHGDAPHEYVTLVEDFFRY